MHAAKMLAHAFAPLLCLQLPPPVTLAYATTHHLCLRHHPEPKANFERNSENGAFEEQYRQLVAEIEGIYAGAKEFHQHGCRGLGLGLSGLASVGQRLLLQLGVNCQLVV